MAGVQETKELIKFISNLGEGIASALEDGKWTATDFVHFLPALQSAFAGIGGLDKVGEELLDLDETEKQELKDYVASEFDIPSDQTEEYIEKAINLAFDLWSFISQFIKKEEV